MVTSDWGIQVVLLPVQQANWLQLAISFNYFLFLIIDLIVHFFSVLSTLLLIFSYTFFLKSFLPYIWIPFCFIINFLLNTVANHSLLKKPNNCLLFQLSTLTQPISTEIDPHFFIHSIFTFFVVVNYLCSRIISLFLFHIFLLFLLS